MGEILGLVWHPAVQRHAHAEYRISPVIRRASSSIPTSIVSAGPLFRQAEDGRLRGVERGLISFASLARELNNGRAVPAKVRQTSGGETRLLRDAPPAKARKSEFADPTHFRRIVDQIVVKIAQRPEMLIDLFVDETRGLPCLACGAQDRC